MIYSVAQGNIINAHYSKDCCVFSEAEGLKATKVFFLQESVDQYQKSIGEGGRILR